jgi:hypothetical protein
MPTSGEMEPYDVKTDGAVPTQPATETFWITEHALQEEQYQPWNTNTRSSIKIQSKTIKSFFNFHLVFFLIFLFLQFLLYNENHLQD